MSDNMRDFLRSHTGKEPSDFGVQVGEILGYAMRGIYHHQIRPDRVDWTHPKQIMVKWCGGISSFDSDELTRLYLSCVLHRIRLEIEHHCPGYLKLWFSQRQETGRMYERHPSIDELVAETRKFWGLEETRQ